MWPERVKAAINTAPAVRAASQATAEMTSGKEAGKVSPPMRAGDLPWVRAALSAARMIRSIILTESTG